MLLRSAALFWLIVLLLPAPAAEANGDVPYKSYKHYKSDKAAHCRQVRVTVPAVYETVRDRVLVSPGGCEDRVEPAVYGWSARPLAVEAERWSRTYQPPAKVVAAPKWGHKGRVAKFVRPGHILEKRKPTAVAWDWQRVRLAPPRLHRVCRPALYKTVERKIVVAPPHWDWRVPPGC